MAGCSVTRLLPDQDKRVPCQVCGRPLVPLSDGTARRHGRPGECSGSGYRLALWPVGQRLTHYAGSVFEVVSTRPYSGPSHQWMSNYVMRCISDPHKTSGVEPGETSTFHGEYMHRHGWKPLPRDLMADLARSLIAAQAPASGKEQS